MVLKIANIVYRFVKDRDCKNDNVPHWLLKGWLHKLWQCPTGNTTYIKVSHIKSQYNILSTKTVALKNGLT